MGDAVRLRRIAVRLASDYCPASIVFTVRLRRNTQLPKKLRTHLEGLSKDIYRLLGMSGYARLDYRVTDAGDAYLLEANPNPQIAEDEDFAQSALHVGIAYPELIAQLMQFGLNYAPSGIID